MLEIKAETATASKTTPHLLPCRIHHDGVAGTTRSFWSPDQCQGEPLLSAVLDGNLATSLIHSEDGTKTAYFRGRKLQGRAVKLPEGYRGVVAERLEPKDQTHQQQPQQDDSPEVIDVDADDQVDIGTIETKAEFDELVVWDHEATTDTGAELYSRGVEEWLEVAENVCSTLSKLKCPGRLTMIRYIHTAPDQASRLCGRCFPEAKFHGISHWNNAVST